MFQQLPVLAAAASLAMGGTPVIGIDFTYLNYDNDGNSYFGKIVTTEGETTIVRIKEVTSEGQADFWILAANCSNRTLDGDPLEPETLGEDWWLFACAKGAR